MISERQVGLLQLVLAQFGVGSTVVISKYLLESGVSVIAHIEFRFVFCTLMLLAFLALQFKRLSKRQPITWQMSRKDWLYLMLQSLTGGLLFNVLMLLGLKYTTATAAGIIGSAIPAMIALFSYLFLKEYLSRLKLIAIFLAMFGIVVIHLDTLGTEKASAAVLGGFIVFAALIPEALYTIFAKLVGKHVHPILQAICINFMSSLMFLPIWWYYGGWQDTMGLNQHHLGLLLLSSFFAVLFYYCWNAALSIIQASTAAIFTGVMPVSTMIAAIFFLHESFSWYDAAGLSLVLISIILGARRSKSE